jgi:hypothetical protein
MSGEQLNDRLNVWVAIGMSMAVLNMSKRRLTRPPPRLRVLPQPHPRPSGATCHRQEPPSRGASRLVLHERTRSGGRDSRRNSGRADRTLPSAHPTPDESRPAQTVAAETGDGATLDCGRGRSEFRASARPGTGLAAAGQMSRRPVGARSGGCGSTGWVFNQPP